MAGSAPTVFQLAIGRVRSDYQLFKNMAIDAIKCRANIDPIGMRKEVLALGFQKEPFAFYSGLRKGKIGHKLIEKRQSVTT